MLSNISSRPPPRITTSLTAQCIVEVYRRFFSPGSKILVSLDITNDEDYALGTNDLDYIPDRPNSTCRLRPSLFGDLYYFPKCAIDIIVEHHMTGTQFVWNLETPSKRTNFSEIYDRVLEDIHSLQFRVVVNRGRVNTISFVFHQFDGYIIFLLGNELWSTLYRCQNLMKSLSIQKIKIIFVILGIAVDLDTFVGIVNTYSLYETVALIEDENTGEINI